MQKVYKALGAVVGKVLFVGFLIQIVLGISWMVMNFSSAQRFGESALYVEISKTLICDEYEGILYPVLIMIARGIAEIFPIPYYCILYLMQLAVAYFAGNQFLKSVGLQGRVRRVVGTLAMLTFPMVMQCHLAVLPDSLLSSCLLLEMAYGLQILLKGQTLYVGEFVKVLTFWLLAGLLQPEYLYLGAIPVAVLFLYGLIKGRKESKRRILYNSILIFAFAGMIMGMVSLTRVEGYYGRTHQSMEAATASRFVWPYVHKDYQLWPREVQEQFTAEEIAHMDYYADNMDRILGRKLEEVFGVEKAREYLGEIARIGWINHRHLVVHDLVWDVVGYTFSPLVVQRQLTGKVYDSYTGRNYDVMRTNTPQLAEYYLNYSCWWFGMGMCLAVLQQLLVLLKEKRSFWSVGKITALLGWMLMILGVVFYHTMRGAGMMDYKKSIVVILLWIVWMVRYVGGSNHIIGNDIAGDTHHSR